jgi:integrase
MPAKSLPTSTAILEENIREARKGLTDGKPRTVLFYGDGLMLRLGRKTASWVVIRTVREVKEAGVRNKRSIVTLGLYPSLSLAKVRLAAEQARATLGSGVDPNEVKRKAREAARAAALAAQRIADDEAAARRRLQEETFSVLTARFIKEYMVREKRRTADAVAKALGPLHFADWANKPVAEITTRDVADKIETIVTRAEKRAKKLKLGDGHGVGVGANRILAYLKRLFGWCVEKGILTSNPAKLVKRPVPEVERDRVLSDAELVELFAAIDEKSDRAFRVNDNELLRTKGGVFAPILKIAAYTGQREGECASMRWSQLHDLDGDKPYWIIPASGSKNKKEHRVELAPAVVDIIKSVRRIAKRDMLFASMKPGAERPVSGWGRLKERLDDAIAANRAKAGVTEAMPGWVFHDLRRTAASGMARLKVAESIVSRVLNHSDRKLAGITAIYNRHDYNDEKRAAMLAWAAHVDTLLGRAAGDNVVPFLRA